MARTPRGPRDASGVALDAPRPSRRLLALAVVLVVTAFGSLASTPAGRAATSHRASVDRVRIHVPKVFFGMHDSSLQAYGRISFGSVRLWDAGVSWKDVETAPGVYDFGRLDALVGAAQDHGARVTLVLAMTPAFYSSSPTLPPTDLSHFADYVRAVMTVLVVSRR